MSTPGVAGFLSSAGWAGATRLPLAGDASARRYDRLLKADRHAVLMIAPTHTEADRTSLDAFLRVAVLLRDVGLCAPEVFAEDRDQGLILMQDFGDLSLARRLTQGHAAEAYAQAAEIPHHLAGIALPDWIARPDVAAQAAMVSVTFDQLAGSDALHIEMRRALGAALASNADGPLVMSLRDYHADNLIWRPDAVGVRRVGLLDFQDALALPMGYDLASLVDDPRRDVPEALRGDLITRFAAQTGLGPDIARTRLDTLSLLRNLRILGIFHRLARGGKPGYRAFLPRTMRLVARAASNPELSEVQAPVTEVLTRVAAWADGAPA